MKIVHRDNAQHITDYWRISGYRAQFQERRIDQKNIISSGFLRASLCWQDRELSELWYRSHSVSWAGAPAVVSETKHALKRMYMFREKSESCSSLATNFSPSQWSHSSWNVVQPPDEHQSNFCGLWKRLSPSSEVFSTRMSSMKLGLLDHLSFWPDSCILPSNGYCAFLYMHHNSWRFNDCKCIYKHRARANEKYSTRPIQALSLQHRAHRRERWC